MTSIDRAVRPSIPVSVHPTSLRLTAQAPAASEVVLEWGGPGASVFTIKLDAYSELQTIERQTEVQRTADIVRVKNPDDPNQYVDVESVTKVLVQSEKGSKYEIDYQRIQSAQDTEIIKRDQVFKRSGA